MKPNEHLTSRQRSDMLLRHLETFAQSTDPEPQSDYYFGYGVSPDNQPTLEAVKTWVEGQERRFDTFTIAAYQHYDQAAPLEDQLNRLQQDSGLEAAMHMAEATANRNGFLDAERSDPRLFTQGPADPFGSLLQREQNLPEAVGTDLTTAEMSKPASRLDYQVEAIAADGVSRIEVWKVWGEQDTARQGLHIPQPDWEAARATVETVQELMADDKLQSAMTLVEVAAVEAGVLDPGRDDPRLFTQGPADPFSTIRERQLDPIPSAELPLMLNGSSRGHESLEGTAWFEATFEQAPIELLQPLDERVNYALVLQAADPWSEELAVEKYWKEPGGYLGLQSITLNTYDPDDAQQRQQAEQTRADLLAVYDERGLEALMHKAELTGMQQGWLDGNRPDPRLFTQGPVDRFETLTQRLEGEINPYWNTQGETLEAPVAVPEVTTPYWRLNSLPVNNPDGEALGYALHMLVYPTLEDNPEHPPLIPENKSVRMLEMAHFETPAAADRFSQEFSGYLLPGVLEGPELAVEVARLEGLPVEWKTLTGEDLQAYQDQALPLIRQPDEWHPYNPQAERVARDTAEGWGDWQNAPTPSDLDL